MVYIGTKVHNCLQGKSGERDFRVNVNDYIRAYRKVCDNNKADVFFTFHYIFSVLVYFLLSTNIATFSFFFLGIYILKIDVAITNLYSQWASKSSCCFNTTFCIKLQYFLFSM